MPEATPTASTPSAAAVVSAVVEQKTTEAKPADPAAAATPAAIPAAPAKPAEPAQDSMAPRFAALARDSKKLADEKRAWAAERARSDADLKAREAALAARAATVEKLEALKKTDPDAYLRGLFGENYYDALTEMRLSGKAPASLEVATLREEMRQRDERHAQERAQERQAAEAARRKSEEEQTAAARAESDRIVAQFRADTAAAVKGAADDYPYINALGMHATVAAVIEETVKATTERDPESGRIIRPGRVMDWKEAAAAVEAELENGIVTATGSKKWTARQEKAAAEAKAKAEQANGSAKTLTNDAGASTGAAPAANGTKDRYQLFVETLRAEQAKLEAQK